MLVEDRCPDRTVDLLKRSLTAVSCPSHRGWVRSPGNALDHAEAEESQEGVQLPRLPARQAGALAVPVRSVRRRVSRKAWGAGSRDCRARIFPRSIIRGVKVHYSGSAADAMQDHSRCDDVFRRWQAMHMGPGGLGVPQGGCDVAYSHGICPHGFTFVGRGFRNRPGANGTTDCNRRYLAVVIFGGDRTGRRDVTEQQRKSLMHYVRRVRTIFPWARHVGFHSDCAATACPGDELRAFVRRKWG